jgi:hypothetical protein
MQQESDQIMKQHETTIHEDMLWLAMGGEVQSCTTLDG